MASKKRLKRYKGQSVVEFALVLPLLLVLLLGMIELGFAFYDYMIVANANREGIRLAARGQGFEAQDIAARVVVAGGLRQTQGGGFEPNLRTMGDDPNLGILIHYVDFNEEGQPVSIEQPTGGISGTIAVDTGSGMIKRPINWDDTRIYELSTDYPKSSDIDTIINDIRTDEGYDINHNELVVIETFMAHKLLLNMPEFLPFPDPMPFYFRSSMRVTVGARSQQSQ